MTDYSVFIVNGDDTFSFADEFDSYTDVLMKVMELAEDTSSELRPMDASFVNAISHLKPKQAWSARDANGDHAYFLVVS